MKKGFTLVEIMIVVAIIGLLAAIAIPSFMKARTTAQKNSCINSLRQIESAKDQWAVEKGATNQAILPGTTDGTAADSFTNLVGLETGYIKAYPACPAAPVANGTKGTIARASADYNVNPIGSNPVCILGVVLVTDTHVMP